MKFSTEAQFRGFVGTPQIFAYNFKFEYPLYPTFDRIPLKQLQVPDPASTVLGKRMEDLFAFYIEDFTSEEILLQNIQIIQNKETLGEFDFLLKDHASGEITHVELIYKFYVFDPTTGTSEMDHLIGPNKRDSLNRKLQRLQKKQFPLLFHPATRELLKSVGVAAENVLQKMCFKAFVFLPKHLNIPLSTINPETIAGFWIKENQFIPKDFGHCYFFTPKKKFWPVHPGENEQWFSYEEIQPEVKALLKDHYAPLIWMKTPGGNYERFFIVWW